MVNASVQYRSVLKKQLRCGIAARERLLKKLDGIIVAYLEERGECTMDDLIDAFGPPEEMAKILTAEITPQEQEHYRKNTFLKRGLAVVLAATLAVFTFYVWFYKETGLTYEGEFYIVDEKPISAPYPMNEGDIV